MRTQQEDAIYKPGAGAQRTPHLNFTSSLQNSEKMDFCIPAALCVGL